MGITDVSLTLSARDDPSYCKCVDGVSVVVLCTISVVVREGWATEDEGDKEAVSVSANHQRELELP